MEHLFIIDCDINEPSWVKDYLHQVTPLMESYGGSYITRSNTIDVLEGNAAPQYTIVARFPSKEHALAFYNSNEYSPFRLARQKGSNTRLLLVPVENNTPQPVEYQNLYS